MSLAIKFGDSADYNSLSGAIYFDVVTSYTKDIGGRVTEHPIEAGASITDHYISRNSKYSISGVISHVDLSPISSLILLDGEPVMNSQDSPNPVTINDMASGLRRFVPGVIDQFLFKTNPNVVVDQNIRTNSKMSFESFFETLLTGLWYNESRKKWENRMTTAILFEMDGILPVRPINNLICTNISVKEDDESGDALFVDMTLEKVNFVTLEKAEAPKPAPRSNTEKATADKKNKGTKPGTENSPKSPPNDTSTVLGELNKASANIFN